LIVQPKLTVVIIWNCFSKWVL